MPGHYYWDEDGYPRSQYPSCTLLSCYLENDVQSSSLIAREVLEACDDVVSGRMKEWRATGNAHTLTIERQEVEIHNELMEEPDATCTLPIEEFRDALRSWTRLLEERLQPERDRIRAEALKRRRIQPPRTE